MDVSSQSETLQSGEFILKSDLGDVDGRHSSRIRQIHLALETSLMTSQVFIATRNACSGCTEPGPVGRVAKVVGLTVESQGPPAALGEACAITTRGGKETLAEVVGFRDGRVLLMPWEQLEGISAGASVRSTGCPLQVPVGPEVLGRILDPLGRPLDDLGPLPPRHAQEEHRARRAESLPPRTASAKPWPPACASWTPSPPADAASVSAFLPAAAWARAACSA